MLSIALLNRSHNDFILSKLKIKQLNLVSNDQSVDSKYSKAYLILGSIAARDNPSHAVVKNLKTA